ncbi:MAG: hypothetical protein RSC40_02365 [Clostridia bacterium]
MRSKGMWGVVRILFRRLIKQPKLYLVMGMLAIILDEYVGSARQIAALNGIHVNAYGSFACMTSYSYLLLWLAAGFLVLMSDVPFASQLTLFESVRITARQSLCARILYIALSSILYVFCLFLLSSLIQLASLLHPFQWDKALYTFANGNAVGEAFLYVPARIVFAYSPIEAWGMASGLLMGSLTAFGLLLLLGSLLADKRFILGVVGALTALDFAIGYMQLPNCLYYFSPLSWSRLEMLQHTEYYTTYPSAGYCLLMQGGLLLLLFVCCLCFLIKPKLFRHKLLAIGGEYGD